MPTSGMSERSCPYGTMRGANFRAGSALGMMTQGPPSVISSKVPRGCSFSGFTQVGQLHDILNAYLAVAVPLSAGPTANSAIAKVPRDANISEWLRTRERQAINELIYKKMPTVAELGVMKSVDDAVASERDLLAAALGAPGRQVIIRAEEIGPETGWKDGYLSTEYGFCPPDSNEAAGHLAVSPGRVWSDLCERMPGCVARGRVRDSIAALPLVEGTEEHIPDKALWAAVVALGMLCSIYRYEDNNDGYEGIAVSKISTKPRVKMCRNLGPELDGIPEVIGLPYWQISRRMGRAIPHLAFYDQASYNVKIRDPTSTYPYVGRFDNTDLRWPMFGERTEIAFLKGCADTAETLEASFQHGPDAMAACQEAVMNRNNDVLLREMIRLKEILERMPNAFHSISTNPSSGENYVSATEWVRWGKFSAPLSKRAPAASGLQFPPYLLMDAFLGRKKYESFLGVEGVHLRAWLPSNLRAFIAAIEMFYTVPEYVAKSGDVRLMGVLDGIVEAYTGERGFMGTHRYKVFGILEVASKTGRTETNGASGAAELNGRPWELVHKQFADAMKERLEPHRGVTLDSNLSRGSFVECRYKARIFSRQHVDSDPSRTVAAVTLDIADTGITWQPGDRLSIMPLNGWEECAKVAAALGLETMLDTVVKLDSTWQRYAAHVERVNRGTSGAPELTVKDILRRGHLAPITKDLAVKMHTLLRASSNTLLLVLATDEWPVRGSLGDLLQMAVRDTSPHIWDQAFNLNSPGLLWLCDLVSVEVPRTYSISSMPSDELLPSTVELTVSRATYELCSTFQQAGTRASGNSDNANNAAQDKIMRHGVASGFLNPPATSTAIAAGELVDGPEDLLIGVSRPLNFMLPLDGAAPCAMFAGGSGIAPFRAFWQSRISSGAVGRNILFLGVQSRDRFCYEEELRHYVRGGLMEVHVAFSRDSHGLVYDRHQRDLVERTTEPRYIDVLIESHGATVCDLVMSKKQGGLGGYLYVCGSVVLFDSVMKGIRKAIYHNRTSTMETTDHILNNAFAEKRFMLDIFLSPKPLPCNGPTIPLSQLARNTGHRPGSRNWIAVHGSVYDVTEFLPMHPGGTLIIKSNSGVDCSRTFDALAHTNNPEVASLLTKYFIGHLTPRPDFRALSTQGWSGGNRSGFGIGLGSGRNGNDLSGLYDLWADYLRISVETLVAMQFEMDDIMNDAQLWFQGNMINIIGVRTFYQYQTRLLHGGFSALFGAKFNELVLQLSFAVANNTAGVGGGAAAKLPDVLGVVARAKGGPHAIATTREISLIGKLISSSEMARHVEQGLLAYAKNSVALDMGLLEDIREEACHGIDAFTAVAAGTLTGEGVEYLHDAGSGSSQPVLRTDAQRIVAVSSFLLDLMERMAQKLSIYYSKLAQLSVYRPEMEKNPPMARWSAVRRCIRDGSFFVLAPQRGIMLLEAAATTVDDTDAPETNQSLDAQKRKSVETRRRIRQTVDFEKVMSHVQANMATVRQQNVSMVPVVKPTVTRASISTTKNHGSTHHLNVHSNHGLPSPLPSPNPVIQSFSPSSSRGGDPENSRGNADSASWTKGDRQKLGLSASNDEDYDQFDTNISMMSNVAEASTIAAPTTYETYENGVAARRMSQFIDKNLRSIRRLSSRVTSQTQQQLQLQLQLKPKHDSSHDAQNQYAPGSATSRGGQKHQQYLANDGENRGMTNQSSAYGATLTPFGGNESSMLPSPPYTGGLSAPTYQSSLAAMLEDGPEENSGHDDEVEAQMGSSQIEDEYDDHHHHENYHEYSVLEAPSRLMSESPAIISRARTPHEMGMGGMMVSGGQGLDMNFSGHHFVPHHHLGAETDFSASRRGGDGSDNTGEHSNDGHGENEVEEEEDENKPDDDDDDDDDDDLAPSTVKSKIKTNPIEEMIQAAGLVRRSQRASTLLQASTMHPSRSSYARSFGSSPARTTSAQAYYSTPGSHTSPHRTGPGDSTTPRPIQQHRQAFNSRDTGTSDTIRHKYSTPVQDSHGHRPVSTASMAYSSLSDTVGHAQERGIRERRDSSSGRWKCGHGMLPTSGHHDYYSPRPPQEYYVIDEYEDSIGAGSGHTRHDFEEDEDRGRSRRRLSRSRRHGAEDRGYDATNVHKHKHEQEHNHDNTSYNHQDYDDHIYEHNHDHEHTDIYADAGGLGAGHRETHAQHHDVVTSTTSAQSLSPPRPMSRSMMVSPTLLMLESSSPSPSPSPFRSQSVSNLGRGGTRPKAPRDSEFEPYRPQSAAAEDMRETASAAPASAPGQTVYVTSSSPVRRAAGESHGSPRERLYQHHQRKQQQQQQAAAVEGLSTQSPQHDNNSSYTSTPRRSSSAGTADNTMPIDTGEGSGGRGGDVDGEGEGEGRPTGYKIPRKQVPRTAPALLPLHLVAAQAAHTSPSTNTTNTSTGNTGTSTATTSSPLPSHAPGRTWRSSPVTNAVCASNVQQKPKGGAGAPTSSYNPLLAPFSHSIAAAPSSTILGFAPAGRGGLDATPQWQRRSGATGNNKTGGGKDTAVTASGGTKTGGDAADGSNTSTRGAGGKQTGGGGGGGEGGGEGPSGKQGPPSSIVGRRSPLPHPRLPIRTTSMGSVRLGFGNLTTSINSAPGTTMLATTTTPGATGESSVSGAGATKSGRSPGGTGRNIAVSRWTARSSAAGGGGGGGATGAGAGGTALRSFKLGQEDRG